MKKICICLTAILFIFLVPSKVEASSAYDAISLNLSVNEVTALCEQDISSQINVSLSYYTPENVTSEQMSAIVDQVFKELIWQSTNPEVVAFKDNYSNFLGTYSEPVNGIPPVKVTRNAGEAVISVYSPTLNKTAYCNIHVVDAKISSNTYEYYINNLYQFSLTGNATAVSFASSNPMVAAFDSGLGVLHAISPGYTIISCTASNGKVYTSKIEVQTPGINYTELTTYYYTGMSEGCYSHFPLVAKGIQAVSWVSSNPSVLSVSPLCNGKIGDMEIYGVGNSVVSCIDVTGQIYSCNVKVVGGKTWCGFSGGYRLTYNEALSHGYVQDMNKIQDYGDVIYYIIDYNKEIDYQNGYEQLNQREAQQIAEGLLKSRYPNSYPVSTQTGDLVQFTKGKEFARIWVSCYYVEPGNK